MDKDIYLQVELEVYLSVQPPLHQKTGNKPERVTVRAHASSFCLAAVMRYIYVLMCSLNATIYECMQMENSAHVDVYTSQSSSTLAE